MCLMLIEIHEINGNFGPFLVYFQVAEGTFSKSTFKLFLIEGSDIF